MILLFIRPAVFIIFVHGFIIISAIIYSKLEYRKFEDGEKEPTLHYLNLSMNNGSIIPITSANSSRFKSFVDGYVAAYNLEKKRNMSESFGDLTKAYFFSLTTVSGVGNSGMFLQTIESKNFYIFCIIAGVVLYVTALHHIAVLLLPILTYASQIQNERNELTGAFSKERVILFAYGLLIISILFLAISALFAGHSYVFGLYASFDIVLKIGNIKWFAYLLPWNKEAFVVGLDLFMFLGHSLLYAVVYISIHFIKTGELIQKMRKWPCLDGFLHDYEPLLQNDDTAHSDSYDNLEMTENQTDNSDVLGGDTIPQDTNEYSVVK